MEWKEERLFYVSEGGTDRKKGYFIHCREILTYKRILNVYFGVVLILKMVFHMPYCGIDLQRDHLYTSEDY